jgi:hypothetical protein
MSLKELAKIATKLDSIGLTKEADLIDSLLKRASRADIDVESLSYDDELGMTEQRLDSPEKKLLAMIFGGQNARDFGSTPEEAGKNLGLLNDRGVMRLLKDLYTPGASIYSAVAGQRGEEDKAEELDYEGPYGFTSKYDSDQD